MPAGHSCIRVAIENVPYDRWCSTPGQDSRIARTRHWIHDFAGGLSHTGIIPHHRQPGDANAGRGRNPRKSVYSNLRDGFPITGIIKKKEMDPAGFEPAASTLRT